MMHLYIFIYVTMTRKFDLAKSINGVLGPLVGITDWYNNYVSVLES